jgi:hypothetical protein
MKFFLSLFLFLSINVFGADCQVDGISDSPQELSCRVKNLKINLTCQQGSYFVNGASVIEAFHFDVENGPSPLVFKGADFELVVVILRKSLITAEFTQKGKTLKGFCKSPGKF